MYQFVDQFSALAGSVIEDIADNNSSQLIPNTKFVVRHGVTVGNTPPTTPKSGQLWFNTNTNWNLLMFWDSVRSKWLSVELNSSRFSRNSLSTTNSYLRNEEGIPVSNASSPLMMNSTIIGLTSSTRDLESWVVELRTLNTDGTMSASLSNSTISNSRYFTTSSLNVDVNQNIGLAPYVNGTGISYPVVTIFYRWRWS